MRISSNPKDPGYKLLADNQARGCSPRVRLDGEIVDFLITADDDQGMVRVQLRDGVLLATDADGRPKTSIRYGVVTINWIG